MSTAPLVSVVLVTHGAWRWTEAALAALAAHTPLPHEVIVVDNASPDETLQRLRDHPAIRLVENRVNAGFGPACNQGAALARARLLLFLNTDVFVRPGWLEPLLAVLADDPRAAAAVPMLLHPDGTLQNAGPLLGQDGTVRVLGDREDPRRLEYRFRRTVDFGTGACLLIRREAFEQLGGFDPVFAPAYYEDADLGFRLRDAGWETVYEPRSAVVHVLYGSGGLDRATAISEPNRRRFVARWCGALRGRPASLRERTPHALLSARDAEADGRILVLDDGCRDAGGGPLAELVTELVDAAPRARVAWATGALAAGAIDPEPWLARGVELVDAIDPAWLAARRFALDLVVVGAVADRRLPDALLATQPQARRVTADAVADPRAALACPPR